jgi:hypothetical protein
MDKNKIKRKANFQKPKSKKSKKKEKKSKKSKKSE